MDLNEIGDTLIDPIVVEQTRVKQMRTSIESYKKANILLGYISQLRDYAIEFESLSTKLMLYRKDILERYRDILINNQHETIYKALLVPPSTTDWYSCGVHKYKKVKRYSIYYYKNKIEKTLSAMTNGVCNESSREELRKVLDTIITLDRYYDIYDDTIGFFMNTNTIFDSIMRETFPDRIFL